MRKSRSDTDSKPWRNNPFWGFIGAIIGVWLTVASVVMRDIRLILWPAWIISFVPLYMLNRGLAGRFWKTGLVPVFLVWLVLFAATKWVVDYTAPPMPIEATHTGYEPFIGSPHEHFTAAKCQSGEPEVTQERQWTWFLEGARFGCKSNERTSDATIDFEHRLYQAVATHASGGRNAIHVKIAWYSERADGRVKWELSAVCRNLDLDLINTPDHKEVVAVGDAPAVEAKTTTSEFVLHSALPCIYPNYLSLRLARRGDDAEDTLGATAYLTDLYLDSEAF